MTARLTRFGLGVVMTSLLTLTACAGDETERSDEAFCAAIAALADNDPFADLATAAPAEMQTAFDQLAEGARAITSAAPSDLAVAATRYRDAIDTLTDELRAAGFDPRQLDPLTYGAAATDYEAAAVSLENASQERCEPPPE